MCVNVSSIIYRTSSKMAMEILLHPPRYINGPATWRVNLSHKIKYQSKRNTLQHCTAKLEQLLDPPKGGGAWCLRHASKSTFGLVRPWPLTTWPNSCSLDHLCQLASKSVYSFSKYRIHKFGNGRTNERTDGRTGAEHNASACSLAWRARRHKIRRDKQTYGSRRINARDHTPSLGYRWRIELEKGNRPVTSRIMSPEMEALITSSTEIDSVTTGNALVS